MPTSNEILKYLYGLERKGIKPGLERIGCLMQALGSPQLVYPCVHIGGTNGKGSTAAMIAAILGHAGYRVGLYTSPHLERFNERIRIGGKEISDAALVKTAVRVKKAARGLPASIGSLSFFEFTTAMAFEYFKEKSVDIAVIEVGMGGRWDATNVVSPLVSIITTVDMDHQEYLGDTLAKLAAEKAGIIKGYTPVICAEAKPQALGVIKKAAKGRNAPLYEIGKDFSVTEDEGALHYRGMDGNIKGLRLGLMGEHQRENAACALAAIEVLKRRPLHNLKSNSTIVIASPSLCHSERSEESCLSLRINSAKQSRVAGKSASYEIASSQETAPRNDSRSLYDTYAKVSLKRGRWAVPVSAVRAGLIAVKWPGRVEVIARRPLVIIDSAHNPAGAATLANALAGFKYRRLILVMGIMADKDIDGIMAELMPLADSVIFTAPATDRAALPDELCRKARRYSKDIRTARSVKEACKTALDEAAGMDAVCVTGSIFTVGEARRYLLRACRG